MDLKDEFHMQTAGSLIAIRLVLTAMLKNHPAPEELLQEIKSVIENQEILNGNLLPQVQAAFDERLQELTSHLYARVNQKKDT